jgi:glycosyltransferase involved in cell wall biosynthesis
MKRLLLATDAWPPQVNGVVRTLQHTVEELEKMGIETYVISPERFRKVPLPGYHEIGLALTWPGQIGKIIEKIRPDAIHIPVEGPIGVATRAYCLRRGLAFTTSYHTRIGDYVWKRYRIPVDAGFAYQRWFHNKGAALMVQTNSLMQELSSRGFKNLKYWGRGVDTTFFTPKDRDALDLPRPVFGYIGRVSREKNLDAFLKLDLPGTKVVVGDGPDRNRLMGIYPEVHWLGYRSGEDLVRAYSALDVFVLPSKFETFGLVLLEALACGTPVAAYPVHGPIDVIRDVRVGILDHDLKAAALKALSLDRNLCRQYALAFSWAESTRQFAGNLVPIPGWVWQSRKTTLLTSVSLRKKDKIVDENRP